MSSEISIFKYRLLPVINVVLKWSYYSEQKNVSEEFLFPSSELFLPKWCGRYQKTMLSELNLSMNFLSPVKKSLGLCPKIDNGRFVLCQRLIEWSLLISHAIVQHKELHHVPPHWRQWVFVGDESFPCNGKPKRHLGPLFFAPGARVLEISTHISSS